MRRIPIRKAGRLLVAVGAVTLSSCSGGKAGAGAEGRSAVVTALAVPRDQLGATVRFDEQLYAGSGSAERLLSESLGVADFKSDLVIGSPPLGLRCPAGTVWV